MYIQIYYKQFCNELLVMSMNKQADSMFFYLY